MAVAPCDPLTFERATTLGEHLLPIGSPGSRTFVQAREINSAKPRMEHTACLDVECRTYHRPGNVPEVKASERIPSMTTQPFAEVSWPLRADHTALLLIDLQNDFLHLDGWYASHGIDISHMRRVIEPTKQLIGAARAAHIPVIWTTHGFKNESDAGTFLSHRPFLREGGLREGTWGYEIYEEFQVEDSDWIVKKNRLSAFFNTNLELVLRGLKADTVIITGVLTNQCVAATSKDAMFRDLLPTLVEQCCGTTLPELHEPVLRCVEVGWGAVQELTDTLTDLKSIT